MLYNFVVLSVTEVIPAFADPIATFLLVWIEIAEGLYPPLGNVVPGGLPARANVVLACCGLSLSAAVQELVHIRVGSDRMVIS